MLIALTFALREQIKINYRFENLGILFQAKLPT